MTGMDKNARVYVAGHRGMVGSAITRKLINTTIKLTNQVKKAQ